MKSIILSAILTVLIAVFAPIHFQMPVWGWCIVAVLVWLGSAFVTPAHFWVVGGVWINPFKKARGFFNSYPGKYPTTSSHMSNEHGGAVGFLQHVSAGTQGGFWFWNGEIEYA